jgi:hypothetical protein
MVAISLSVRALLLTVVTLASTVKIERPVEDYGLVFTVAERDAIARRMLMMSSRTNAQMAVGKVFYDSLRANTYSE